MLTNLMPCGIIIKPSENRRQYADVAELADALDSGSSESNFMGVQVPSSAPNKHDGFDTKPSCFFLYPKSLIPQGF